MYFIGVIEMENDDLDIVETDEEIEEFEKQQKEDKEIKHLKDEVQIRKDEIEDLEKQKKKVKEKIKEELKPQKPKEKLELKFECDKKVLKSLIEKVGGLNDDITLSVTKQGLRTKQVDISHVAMVDMTIKKSAFDEYYVNHDCKIGISIPILTKHLKIFDSDITITNSGNQLLFKGSGGRESKMGLQDSALDVEPKLPNINFSISAKTKAENIMKMVEIAQDFETDMLRFSIQHDELYILMETDTDNVRFPICSINRLDDNKDFETLYSVDYLKMIMNFNNDDTVVLKFGKNIPMYVGLEDKNLAVSYLLAPRIDNDQEE